MPTHSADTSAPTLPYLIGRVNQGIRRELGKRLEPWALSIPEYTLLSVLKRRPGLSNAQLARRGLLTPQSTGEVLARLEERGVVSRKVDPNHARILRTELTRAGARLLEDVEPAAHEMQEQMLGGVTARQRETALNVLTHMMDRLADGLDHPNHR